MLSHILENMHFESFPLIPTHPKYINFSYCSNWWLRSKISGKFMLRKKPKPLIYSFNFKVNQNQVPSFSSPSKFLQKETHISFFSLFSPWNKKENPRAVGGQLEGNKRREDARWKTALWRKQDRGEWEIIWRSYNQSPNLYFFSNINMTEN